MLRIFTLTLITLSLVFVGCGTSSDGDENANSGKTSDNSEAASSNFTLKIDGETKSFAQSSSWATHWEKSFSYPVDGETKTDKTSHTEIFLANYELDSKDGKYSLAKQEVSKPEQIKIEIAINGDKGTDSESPIKVGKYEIKPGDYMKLGEMHGKIDSVDVFHFVDGKEKETSLLGNKMTGTLEVTKVSDNKIEGTINVTDGKHTVSGSFAANGDNTVK